MESTLLVIVILLIILVAGMLGIMCFFLYKYLNIRENELSNLIKKDKSNHKMEVAKDILGDLNNTSLK